MSSKSRNSRVYITNAGQSGDVDQSVKNFQDPLNRANMAGRIDPDKPPANRKERRILAAVKRGKTNGY